MSDTDQSENLTILERDILTLAVQGEGLDLLLLQKQIDFAKAEKRESSGVGLFVNLKMSVPENVRGYTKRMQLSNVHEECSELSEGFGVTIFVEGGMLKLLELYSYGEGWPEQITNVRLSRIE